MNKKGKSEFFAKYWIMLNSKYLTQKENYLCLSFLKSLKS